MWKRVNRFECEKRLAIGKDLFAFKLKSFRQENVFGKFANCASSSVLEGFFWGRKVDE